MQYSLCKNRLRKESNVSYDLQVISVIVSLLIKTHWMISDTSKENFVKSKSSEEKVQNVRGIDDAVFAKSCEWFGRIARLS